MGNRQEHGMDDGATPSRKWRLSDPLRRLGTAFGGLVMAPSATRAADIWNAIPWWGALLMFLVGAAIVCFSWSKVPDPSSPSIWRRSWRRLAFWRPGVELPPAVPKEQPLAEPERRVQIEVDVGQSQLDGRGRWTLWLYLRVSVKQEKPAFIHFARASWEDKLVPSPLDLKDWPPTVALPPDGPIQPIKEFKPPRSGYLAFDFGPPEDYEDSSIFDGVSTLNLRFIDEPEFEYRCKALRWPEGTPGADVTSTYGLETVADS